jgi:hypothetical protein
MRTGRLPGISSGRAGGRSSTPSVRCSGTRGTRHNSTEAAVTSPTRRPDAYHRVASRTGVSGFILARVAEASPPGIRGITAPAWPTRRASGDGLRRMPRTFDVAKPSTSRSPAPEVCDRPCAGCSPGRPNTTTRGAAAVVYGRIALPDDARPAGLGLVCAPLGEWDGVVYTDRWPGDPRLVRGLLSARQRPETGMDCPSVPMFRIEDVGVAADWLCARSASPRRAGSRTGGRDSRTS